jgi:hypothetical protein
MTLRKKPWQKPKRLKRLMARAAATCDLGRECGGCTACCTVMAVSELQKGMYQTCSHVGNQGCGIYPDRPRSCHSWSCQWRLGEIDGPRPDQAGVIVNLGFRGGPHYEVYELWEGAAFHPLVVDTLAKLPLPVFIFPLDSQGRAGVQFRGQRAFTNHCPFGHGKSHWRISLPVLSS